MMETETDNLRYTKLALNNGSGAIPALGFGTLIPDRSQPKTQPRRRWRQDFAHSKLRNAIEQKQKWAKR